MYFTFKGTGLRLSACSCIKFVFSNLLLLLSANSPTHMYLSDLRVYLKVQVYFRVTKYDGGVEPKVLFHG